MIRDRGEALRKALRSSVDLRSRGTVGKENYSGGVLWKRDSLYRHPRVGASLVKDHRPSYNLPSPACDVAREAIPAGAEVGCD